MNFKFVYKMSCLSLRTTHNIFIPNCSPNLCPCNNTAFSFRPLCPCPELQDNEIFSPSQIIRLFFQEFANRIANCPGPFPTTLDFINCIGLTNWPLFPNPVILSLLPTLSASRVLTSVNDPVVAATIINGTATPTNISLNGQFNLQINGVLSEFTILFGPLEIEGINLRVINNSNDFTGSVLIFQKNVSSSFDETATAWIFTENLNQSEMFSFTFGSELRISATDQFGNTIPSLQATPGTQYTLIDSGTGAEIITDFSSSMRDIEFRNQINGTVTANIYRSNKLLISKTVVPEQTVTFQFKPTIWIGVAAGLTEGQELDSSILSSINTEISLLGIDSADIVMTGGGIGPSATPISFSLENIVFA